MSFYRSERGFSLIEVMISMLVFAASAMGLVALHKVSMNSLVLGRDRTAAANVAQYAMTWIENEVSAYGYEANLNDYPMLTRIEANLDNWQTLDTHAQLRIDEHFGTSAQAHYDDVDSAKFCASYFVSKFAAGSNDTSTDSVINNLYRVTIEVNWPKEKRYSDGWKDCTTRIGNPNNDYHTLVLSKVLTRDFADNI